MNIKPLDCKSRTPYTLYQPHIIRPNIVKKYITYFEINTDGIINTNELTESQIMMLNNGEDIVIIKNIDLDKTKYKTIIEKIDK